MTDQENPDARSKVEKTEAKQQKADARQVEEAREKDKVTGAW